MAGLKMKYFVLKPNATDPFAKASRLAMSAYARSIYNTNRELSEELTEWVKSETLIALD